MKSLKSKGKQPCAFLKTRPLTQYAASRFFTDSASRDEKVAHAEPADSFDFDAGIHSHGLKKKCN
jgi:hypothetical protein